MKETMTPRHALSGEFDNHSRNPKQREKIMINPPPEDLRCECCGRHISELKPFGKAGDPLVGDFNGQVLVKKFRPMGPYDAEAEFAMSEALKSYETDGFDNPLDWMKNKYGEEKGKGLYYADSAHDCIRASWECRDCIGLDLDTYLEKAYTT